MSKVLNLFELDIPYIEVPPVDYGRLLASCDPDALMEQRGSIFPQGDVLADVPDLPEDYDVDAALGLK